ncbi:hypothetical protein HDU76_013652 [Blyttiomyces sp. JEL0837]|nr:hypothetical protein HDU76_013652 [Blyttiomyces sp. JEL0837]
MSSSSASLLSSSSATGVVHPTAPAKAVWTRIKGRTSTSASSLAATTTSTAHSSTSSPTTATAINPTTLSTTTTDEQLLHQVCLPRWGHCAQILHGRNNLMNINPNRTHQKMIEGSVPVSTSSNSSPSSSALVGGLVRASASASTLGTNNGSYGLDESDAELFEMDISSQIASVKRTSTLSSVPSELVVLGGLNDEDFVLKCQSLNLGSHTWSSVDAEMSKAVFGYASSETKVYMFGGVKGVRDQDGDFQRSQNLELLEYDALSQTVRQLPIKNPNALSKRTRQLLAPKMCLRESVTYVPPLPPSQSKPITTSSSSASAAAISEQHPRLFVYGGRHKNTDFNGLHILDLATLEWVEPVFETAFRPDDREGHTAVFWPGDKGSGEGRKIIVFGGLLSGSEARSNNVFFLHMRPKGMFRWEKVNITEGPLPSPRLMHSAVIWGNKMVVYGGKQFENDESTSQNSVSLSPPSGGINSAAPSSKKQSNLNDVWLFDIVKRQWEACHIQYGSVLPPLRAYMSVAMFYNQLYLYGGYTEMSKTLESGNAQKIATASNDLWVLDLGPPPPPGCPHLEFCVPDSFTVSWSDPFRHQIGRRVRVSVRKEGGGERDWCVVYEGESIISELRIDSVGDGGVVAGSSYEVKVAAFNDLGESVAGEGVVGMEDRDGGVAQSGGILKVTVPRGQPSLLQTVTVKIADRETEDPKISVFWETAGDDLTSLTAKVGSKAPRFRVECAASVRLHESEVVALYDPPERRLKRQRTANGDGYEVVEFPPKSVVRERVERGEPIDTFQRWSGSQANGGEDEKFFPVWEGSDSYMELDYKDLFERPEVVQAYVKSMEDCRRAVAVERKNIRAQMEELMKQGNDCGAVPGGKRKADGPPGVDGASGGDPLADWNDLGVNVAGKITTTWPSKHVIITYVFRVVAVEPNTNEVSLLSSHPIEWSHQCPRVPRSMIPQAEADGKGFIFL